MSDAFAAQPSNAGSQTRKLAASVNFVCSRRKQKHTHTQKSGPEAGWHTHTQTGRECSAPTVRCPVISLLEDNNKEAFKIQWIKNDIGGRRRCCDAAMLRWQDLALLFLPLFCMDFAHRLS